MKLKSNQILEWAASAGAKTVSGPPSVFCVRVGDKAHPAIMLLSGVHGDEQSGPITLARMLNNGHLEELAQENSVCIYIVPLLNPDGWDAGTREYRGTDLNRKFTRRNLDVIAEVTSLIEKLPLRAFMDLHEDKETPHPYIFTLDGQEDRFNTEFAAAMGCKTSSWEMSRKWEGSSEGFARGCGIEVVSTSEVPPGWDLAKRVNWNERTVMWFIHNSLGSANRVASRWLHAGTIRASGGGRSKNWWPGSCKGLSDL